MYIFFYNILFKIYKSNKNEIILVNRNYNKLLLKMGFNNSFKTFLIYFTIKIFNI